LALEPRWKEFRFGMEPRWMDSKNLKSENLYERDKEIENGRESATFFVKGGLDD
jgi:hypothetical protein